MHKNNMNLAIVDDHPMVLEGLKSLLQQNEMFQIFSFTKGAAVLDFILENRIDVLLLDIVLKGGNGLDFCKIIKKQSPNTLILAVSNQAERSIILRFLENGGSGYILKNADAKEIMQCIQDAINGKLALCKDVQEIMAKPSLINYEIPRITKRELQILKAVSEGQTSAEIADKLFISVITVETHRRNLMQKFQAKNMIELVKIATDNKLI
ncbi:response regulator [Flavobacterium sp. I3-2]|uniref:response regulator n=1 Tax=Flavobacterium sp. I3-2 TaxID=2748319 RepID=UPI0015AEA7F4|nr:response regulator transcription factor [Flavobacterium sp. I3-2]